MSNTVKDILALDDIKGIIILSQDGHILVKEIIDPLFGKVEQETWFIILNEIKDSTKELELIYERDKIYIRKSDKGMILIWMGHFAPISMIRIHCNLIIQSLKKNHKSTKLKRFFQKG
jgi:hypothetical protein